MTRKASNQLAKVQRAARILKLCNGANNKCAKVGCVPSGGNFSLCQLDTCKCVVLFFMYICKCSLMPFLYVLFVKILSYVEEIKNIYLMERTTNALRSD